MYGDNGNGSNNGSGYDTTTPLWQRIMNSMGQQGGGGAPYGYGYGYGAPFAAPGAGTPAALPAVPAMAPTAPVVAPAVVPAASAAMPAVPDVRTRNPLTGAWNRSAIPDVPVAGGSAATPGGGPAFDPNAWKGKKYGDMTAGDLAEAYKATQPDPTLGYVNAGIQGVSALTNLGMGIYSIVQARDAFNFSKNIAERNIQGQEEAWADAKASRNRGRA